MKQTAKNLQLGRLFLAAFLLCLLAVTTKTNAVEVDKIKVNYIDGFGAVALSAEKPAFINNSTAATEDVDYVKTKGIGAWYENKKLHLYNYDGGPILFESGTDGSPVYIVLHGTNKISGSNVLYGLRASEDSIFITTEGDEEGKLIIDISDKENNSVYGIQAGIGDPTPSVYIQKKADVSIQVKAEESHTAEQAQGISVNEGSVYIQDHAKVDLKINFDSSVTNMTAAGIVSQTGMLDISTDQEISIDVSNVTARGTGINTSQKNVKLTNTPKLEIKAHNSAMTKNLIRQKSGTLDISNYYYNPSNTNDEVKNSASAVTYLQIKKISIERATFYVNFGGGTTNYLLYAPPYGYNISDYMPTFTLNNITYDGNSGVKGSEFSSPPIEIIDGRWEVLDEVTDSWVEATGKATDGYYRYYLTLKANTVENMVFDIKDDIVVGVARKTDFGDRVDLVLNGSVDHGQPGVNAQIDAFHKVSSRNHAMDTAYEVYLSGVKNPGVGTKVSEQLDNIEVTDSNRTGTAAGDVPAFFYESNPDSPMYPDDTFEFNKTYHLRLSAKLDGSKAKFADLDKVDVKGVPDDVIKKITKKFDSSGVNLIIDIEFEKIAGCEVTFDADNGSGKTVKQTWQKNYGYNTLPDPSSAEFGFTPQTGMVFAGWQVAEGDIRGAGDTYGIANEDSITIKATWKKDTWEVDFMAEEGGEQLNYPDPVEKGKKYTLPESDYRFITPPGQIFDRWKWMAGGEKKTGKAGEQIDVTENIILIPVWRDDTTVLVCFDADGGSGTMEDVIVEKDSSYTLPACTFTAPAGKEFDQWDKGTVGASVKITADMTIKAVWKDKLYKVTFDANGGTGEMAAAEVKENADYALPACTFTAPAGKEFDQWDKGAVGTSVKVTADMTIKAVWKDKPAEGSGSGSESGSGSGTATQQDEVVVPTDGGGAEYKVISTGDTDSGSGSGSGSGSSGGSGSGTGEGATVSYQKPAADNDLTEITIPDEVTLPDGTKARVVEISKGAYAGNTKITKIIIGKYVKIIQNNAFKGCTALTTVTFKGNALTTIKAGAFMNCKKLKKFTITKKVTTIGKNAFKGCVKLKTITIKSKLLTKKKTGKNAFSGIYKTATFKQPSGLSKKKKTEYKALLKKANIPAKAKIK